jgi:hypothetical protein
MSLIAAFGTVTKYHVFAVLVVVLIERVFPLMALVRVTFLPVVRFLMVILLK